MSETRLAEVEMCLKLFMLSQHRKNNTPFGKDAEYHRLRSMAWKLCHELYDKIEEGNIHDCEEIDE